MPKSSGHIDDLLALYDQGRLQDTLKRGRELAGQYPNVPQILFILGAANAGLGRWDEAIAHYRKLLQLKPGHAEAHTNLGNALITLGKDDEAAACYAKALKLKPDFPLAHYNLGNALQNLGRHEEAALSYASAIQIKPDFAAAHNSLGNVLYFLKRHRRALASYASALALVPDRKPIWVNLAKVLNEMSFRKYDRKIEDIFLRLLERKTIVRPIQYADAILGLMKPHPAMDEALRMLAAGKIHESAFDISSMLSSVRLFLRIIELCPIPDLQIESLLTELRKALLLRGGLNKDKAGTLGFQTSLALHCFTNEFVFSESAEETAAVAALESDLEKSAGQGAEADPFKIACLASYRPLHRYDWVHDLAVPDGLQRLFKRQVEDVLEEALLRPSIPCLKRIDAPVSNAVREQYEENPYPRWVDTKLPQDPLAISAVVKNLELNLREDDQGFSDRPDILVAGCGTGQHSLVTASRFSNCRVLAVDLSLSSLCHAMRKMREFGVSNIEYMQADILDLERLGRQFDLVESVGVLHHMADPMAGWKVLASCTKPKGLMKIGLYSELGRKSVAQARRMIAAMGLDNRHDDIRKFREMILNGEAGAGLEPLAKMKDFYSTSSCRDLLFHVQEHRFTLLQIKDALGALGLTFVGIEMSGRATKQKMKRRHPDPQAAYSLDAWHEFETANPDTFRGLYQLWVQKNG